MLVSGGQSESTRESCCSVGPREGLRPVRSSADGLAAGAGPHPASGSSGLAAGGPPETSSPPASYAPHGFAPSSSSSREAHRPVGDPCRDGPFRDISRPRPGRERCLEIDLARLRHSPVLSHSGDARGSPPPRAGRSFRFAEQRSPPKNGRTRPRARPEPGLRNRVLSRSLLRRDRGPSPRAPRSAGCRPSAPVPLDAPPPWTGEEDQPAGAGVAAGWTPLGSLGRSPRPDPARAGCGLPRA